MKPEDRKRLQQLAADLPSDIRLRLVLTRHDLSDRFQTYGRQLQEAVPGMELVTVRESDGAPPWIETEAGIRFHALPEGEKLHSLMDALQPADIDDAAIPAAQVAWLQQMSLPAEIRLYIAPACPFCPRALQQWVTLARTGRQLRLRVIDGSLFPEKAREDKIQAVPTLVLDPHLRWSGRIPVDAVLEQLATRDPSRLGSEALDGLIKEGLAGQVAQAMIAAGHLFPPIFDLLTHPKWPVRLGAMVVMETITAADPGLAAEAVPALRQRYDRLEDAAKGDVLYIIGETGDHRLTSFLEDIAATSGNSEVGQAAQEALARIQQRHGRCMAPPSEGR
jgi:hypothetical protein